MRDILFRGKREVTGKWVYGFYYKDKTSETDYIITWEDGTGRGCLSIEEFRLVRPATVGQFTGLTDKNGKKIFEGDILSTENGTFSNTGMGHILFYKGMWTSFYGQDAVGRDCFDELHTVCNSREVIGNIHDNPELLEVSA